MAKQKVIKPYSIKIDISKVPDCALEAFCLDTVTLHKKHRKISKTAIIDKIITNKNDPDKLIIVLKEP